MKLKVARASTSRIARLYCQDTSSTTGGGLTGLTSASSGLTCYYLREGDASATAVTLSGGTVGTWSSGGFKEVDSTNLPGIYELGLPNAALASGNSVVVMLKGATNLAPTLLEIELDAVNYQDGVRAGLTALPNAAAGASGGLPTGDASGRVTVISNADKTGYTVSTVSDKTGYSLSSAQTFNLTGNVTGNLSGSVGSVTGAVGSVTGAVGSVAAAVTAGTVSDKTGYALTTAEHTAISGTDVPAGLTAQGYTTARAGYLDTLNGLVAAIWASVSRTLTTVADSSGVTTLLSRLTAGRATGLDNLDASVSSRMATFTYTAPTNPTDYAKSNVAPSWYTAPDNADVATALSNLVTLVARADPATALSTLQTAANAIKAKTDQLTFTGSNVNAAISGDATTTLYGDAGAIDWTYTVFDVDGTTPLPGTSVQVSADSAGTHRSQAKLTDSLGRVHFALDAGAVYVFRSRADRTFSNPDTEEVS